LTGSARTSWLTSIRWSGTSVIATQAIRLGAQLAFAAILGPSLVGYFTQAQLAYGLLAGITLQGFTASLLRGGADSSDDTSTALAAFSRLLGIAGAVILCVTALALRGLWGESALLLACLAPSLALQGLWIPPWASLLRAGRIATVARAEITAAAIGATIGTTIALCWSTTISMVVFVVSTDLTLAVILVYITRDNVLRRPNWRAISKERGFLIHNSGSELLNYLSRNADNILVAALLGPRELALYSLAYRIISLTVQQLTQTVSRVALPRFARDRTNAGIVAADFVLISRGLAVVAGAALATAFAVAPAAVPWILGPAWTGAVAPLQWLCLAAIRQSIQSIVWPTVLAYGRARWNFFWHFCPVPGGICPIGSPWHRGTGCSIRHRRHLPLPRSSVCPDSSY